ncbi:MAG TPA: protease HTPX-like protein [Methanosarcinaceae archaeon]|nr:protease HTPX-like protein [Methanosarcinaceae archaeon]
MNITKMDKLKIALFFVVPSIPFVLIAGIFGGIPIAGIVLVVMLILSYFINRFSGKILLRWYGARKVDTSESFELNSILGTLSNLAQVTEPNLYVFESQIPAMFTVGTGSRASVAVSTKAMDFFDSDELEVLFAHEIGHIKNGDVPLSTVTALFAGTLASFSTAALWGSLLTGFGQEYDPAPRLIRFLAMGLVGPPAALLVQFSTSRAREYAADEVSTILTDNSQLLVETLERIERYVQLQHLGEINPGHAHMFPVNLLKVEESYDLHLSMFDTHPDIQSRENNLSWKKLLTSKHQTLHEVRMLNETSVIKDWNKAMAFSFISYFMVLFGIIVIDVFARKDFDFGEVSLIAGVYVGALILLMLIEVTVFRSKLNAAKD